MTTAYSEPSTERVPGRAWTVRITGHSDRSATVSCSTSACRMPPRSKDLAALRAFAARHAAAHARAATVRPHAWCHCGSQRCAAHPDATTHCAGAVLLILRHDPTVGRVWSVEEVCEACAPLLAHATVLARAAQPRRRAAQPTAAQPPVQVPAARPGIPGGFSAPATGPAEVESRTAPARRGRRAPQRPRRQGPGQSR
ncbi:hypothetical protein DIZ27_31810 [Streptomyces sp. NWU339]|uniref:hypothetical protein n=1 Tax=Streptomyces sp. NWU339 TaxID=2185284 RepID=UPI000D675B43|nr:hypothetical protein [Streptomyces sp. NWU339]PWI06702.1 hypothetical protein DIZ27_31810 [Streptomyces sp. NWU339]